MRRTTILNAAEVRRTAYSEAESAFIKHCRVKNLRSKTITYYEEDIEYFHTKVPVKYIDEITQDRFDDFIVAELDDGKKVTSLNTRIRGLRVFFSFCAEREYMNPIAPKLMKADEEIKEPYTEAELKRLLKRPSSNRWTEWRTWAAINYLISTGNRVSTVVNLKIGDINGCYRFCPKENRQVIHHYSGEYRSPLSLYQPCVALYGLFDPFWLYAYIPLRCRCAGVLQKPLDKGYIVPVAIVYLRGVPFAEAVCTDPLITQIVTDGL